MGESPSQCNLLFYFVPFVILRAFAFWRNACLARFVGKLLYVCFFVCCRKLTVARYSRRYLIRILG